MASHAQPADTDMSRSRTELKTLPRTSRRGSREQANACGSEMHSELTPGVRDRLLERLVAMGLPTDKRISYVAGLTGRAAQTVRRWFAPQAPGLPDLQSFARLCIELGCSADDVMGLSDSCQAVHEGRSALLAQVAECVQGMARALPRRGRVGEPMRVSGDEMAPWLLDGDMVFVDRSLSGVAGNGLYALECNGVVIIRRVEQLFHRGLVFKCDNKAYGDIEAKNVAAVRRMGFRVLGKVQGAITLRVF